MPPSLKAAGALHNAIAPSGVEIKSPWESAIAVQGLLQNFRSTEAPGFREFASMAMNLLVSIAERAPYDLGAYRAIIAPKRGTYSADNLWFTADDYLLQVTATVTSNRLTVTKTSDGLRYNVQNGDVIRFSTSNASASSVAIPPEYPQETIFYAVNSSGLSCDLALTPGGSPVALTAGNYTIGGRFFGSTLLTPAVNPPYLPTSDSYVTINEAAFAYGESVGLETLPAGTFAAIEAFLINSDRANWPAWNLKPPV